MANPLNNKNRLCYFPDVENKKNTMSNFILNSGKLTCSQQQSLENYYLQNLISIHICTTKSELEAASTKR